MVYFGARYYALQLAHWITPDPLAEDANGVESTLIATSEPGGYLRPGVTLRPGEIRVGGTGDAEMNIADYARANNLFLKQLGATRSVCQDCAFGIPWGTLIVTPLKAGVR